MSMSPKDARLERKKRKLKAFLQLAKEENRETNACDEATSITKLSGDAVDANDAGRPAMKLPTKKVKEDHDDEIKRLRMEYRERRKLNMQKPKLFLTPNVATMVEDSPSEEQPKLSVDEVDTGHCVSELYMMDLQHLMLYAFQGGESSYMPRWCKLLRWEKVSQILVVVLNHISRQQYLKHKNCFPFLSDNFSMNVPLVNPSSYGETVAKELFTVPLSGSQILNLRKQEREQAKRLSEESNKAEHDEEVTSTESKMEVDLNITLPEKQSVLPENSLDKNGNTQNEDLEQTIKVEESEGQKEMPTNEPEPTAIIPKEKQQNCDETKELDLAYGGRCGLLLSRDQLIKEHYPMPVPTSTDKYKQFVFTKDEYKEVTESSPIYALDCEMCLTVAQKHELTRVSVVNEKGKVLYDSLVKPHAKIINYLTQFSGITAEMLEKVQTRLKHVQQAICELLPQDAILAGHSLGNDLKALKMFHPYIIDTSVVYNLVGRRWMKPSLRNLASLFLGQEIQKSKHGHDSTEDARATLDLVHLKIYRGFEFGDAVFGALHFPSKEEVEEFQEYKKCPAKKKSKQLRKHRRTRCRGQKNAFFQRNQHQQSFFSITEKFKKSVSLVGSEQNLKEFSGQSVNLCKVTRDKEVVQRTRDAAQEHYLLYSMLTGSISYQDEQHKQRCFTKLDNHVKKMVKSVKENSLVAVVLAGAEEDSEAMSFLKLTTKEDTCKT